MGCGLPAAAAAAADPEDEDPPTRDEAKVTHEASRSTKAERIAIGQVLEELERLLGGATFPVSKWPAVENECVGRNCVVQGSGEQAVVFTEYADTADWLASRFHAAGYTARRFSGRDPPSARDEVRSAFARRDFQILVSTDPRNRGMGPQATPVPVNWDI